MWDIIMGNMQGKYKKTIFLICIVLVVVMFLSLLLFSFWKYPIAADIREIKEHLLREDQERERSLVVQSEHDREIVKTRASADIVKQLEQIESSVKNVRQSLYTVDENDKKVVSGINNYLGRWEISVYEGNKLNLTVNDMVVISNKTYGEHRPSAIFKVANVSERPNIPVDTQIFMSAETADFLDVPNATNMGKFEVAIHILPKHND